MSTYTILDDIEDQCCTILEGYKIPVMILVDNAAHDALKAALSDRLRLMGREYRPDERVTEYQPQYCNLLAVRHAPNTNGRPEVQAHAIDMPVNVVYPKPVDVREFLRTPSLIEAMDRPSKTMIEEWDEDVPEDHPLFVAEQVVRHAPDGTPVMYRKSRLVFVGFCVNSPVLDEHRKRLADMLEEVHAIAPIRSFLMTGTAVPLAINMLDFDLSHMGGPVKYKRVEGIPEGATERWCVLAYAHCPEHLIPENHPRFALKEGELPPEYTQ